MSTDTPEYKALISPYISLELRDAVLDNINPLSRSLMEKDLISCNDMDQLTNRTSSKTKRATMLVEIIKNRVQQNPQHYYTLVQVLKDQLLYSDHIVHVLQNATVSQQYSLYLSTPSVELTDEGAGSQAYSHSSMNQIPGKLTRRTLFHKPGIFNEGENSSCDYLLHLSRLRRNHEPSVYQVVLTASLGLNVHKEVIQNRNSDWVPILYNPAPFVFNNRSRALILSIDKDGIQSGNWEINPIVMPPQIEKSAVHCFGMASYELIVSWKNKEEEKIPLRYNMEVQGVNLDYFMIYIDPHEKGAGVVSASVTGGDNQIRREFINLRCTEIEHFKELYHQVANIGNWYGLCLNLGVYDGKLNELKHSNENTEERKRECLQVYFDNDEAYWEEVVRAIIQYPVGKRREAKKIIEKKNLRSDLLDIINSHAKLICD